MIKKFTCILIIITMITMAVSGLALEPVVMSGENVTFIVEVVGDPLALSEGIEPLSQASAKEKILDVQNKVMSQINNYVSSDAQKGYVYTSVFNGFSVDGTLGMLDEIKSLPGVKNVYISKEIQIVEPVELSETYLEGAAALTGVSELHEIGYDGEGAVIGIIDAGCDTAHEFFSSEPDNPRYTKEDIDQIVKNTALNANASSANQVYKNAKIPYAYNYVDENADTYMHTGYHGTHVAGIAAGKNGSYSDGTTFSGIAPEAQLLILSCSTQSGMLSAASILAAINDAVLLGADVINMSFGSDYNDVTEDDFYDVALHNARKAGVAVVTAAGNSSRGYNNRTPRTDRPDYAAMGTPAGVSTVSSVASSNSSNLQSEGASGSVKISSYSSWGGDSTLELKPEITAPGGNIYSSIPDNKYASVSGTSMSAPHMAGVTALSLQYYRTNPFMDKFNGKTGEERVLLMENLAMNSADIVRQDNGVPYSPRVQGAGLVNAGKIIESKVILTGNSGKAKLNLGDDLTENISIEFDITNISTEELTFDKISIELLTDGYTVSGNEYLVGKSVYINYESDTIPQELTVIPGETKTFSAVLNLDSDFVESNSKIFTNGFYIDGYVILDTEDSTDRASIPFMGFYGDWGKAPIFDSTIYDEGGSYLSDSTLTGETGTYVELVTPDGATATLGRNPYFPEIADKKYIAYSSNSGCRFRTVITGFRAVDKWDFSIENSAGEVLFNEEENIISSKFTPVVHAYPEEVMNELEEGSYNLQVRASVAGDTDAGDTLTIPFEVDNTYPEILQAIYDESTKTVTVTAKENHYIAAIYAECGDDYTLSFVEDGDYSGECVTKTLDVSYANDIYDVKIGCVDYALNETYYYMDYFADSIGAEILDAVRINDMTKVEFNVRNNTPEDLTAELILAFYDEDGGLMCLDTKSCVLTANKEERINYSLFEDTQKASYVKLFAWDLSQIKPYDSCKKFKLN